MRKSKRIIIDGEVLVMPHFSGIGHYVFEMMRAIDHHLDNNPQIKAYMFVHFRHIEKAKGYGFKNIKIIRSPFSLRISNALKIRNRQIPLDVLFGKGLYMFPNFTSWPLLYSKSLPFIYDISYERYPQFAEPRNQAFLSTQVKKSVARSSHVVTISEHAKEEICEFYNVPKEKVGVYYPAVNTALYYRRNADEISSVKKNYDLPDNYVLFLGNIEPRKNLKNLLLAYEKLPKDTQKKYPLVLVGAKGWQDGEIFEIISRLIKSGCTIALPNKYVVDEDIPAIYSGAAVFVYPSMYEGFGIPPVEAMACGVPVICADNSSLPEAVGNAAVMVDAQSVDNISNAISKTLSDNALRERLVKDGHEQVKRFSWNDSARKLLDVIETL